MRSLSLAIALSAPLSFRYQLKIMIRVIHGESKILSYLLKNVILTVRNVLAVIKTTARSAISLTKKLCWVVPLVTALVSMDMATILQIVLFVLLVLKDVRPVMLQLQIAVFAITATFSTITVQTLFAWPIAQMEHSRMQLLIQMYAANAILPV